MRQVKTQETGGIPQAYIYQVYCYLQVPSKDINSIYDLYKNDPLAPEREINIDKVIDIVETIQVDDSVQPSFEINTSDYYQHATINGRKNIVISKFSVKCNDLLILGDDLRSFLLNEQNKEVLTKDTSNPHKSAMLITLNQASDKFWKNADQSDSGTHPKNTEIETWLISQGFSQTLAAKGATIIRPEWVPTGRKPEE